MATSNLPRVRCQKCGDLIPPARLEILPDTTTCVYCSDVKTRTTRDVSIDGTDPGEFVQSFQAPDNR